MNKPVAWPLTAEKSEDDPFRFGSRWLKHPQPDGTIEFEEVPLREEDLLYPEEEDRLVTDNVHAEIMQYLAVALRAKFAGSPDVAVRCDHRIGWANPTLTPLGPDVIVIVGVREQRPESATYRIDAQGGRPVMVVEIASWSTRQLDIGIKVDLYEQAGVEYYLVIDRVGVGEVPARLLGYQFEQGRRTLLKPDASGRIWVAPLGFGLAIEGNRCTLIDGATGEPFPVPEEAVLEFRAAQKRAEAEAKRAEDERHRAEAEAKRAEDERHRAEASTRELVAERLRTADLEAKLRALEAELRQARGEE